MKYPGKMKMLLALAVVPLLGACATYSDVKELKLIGFSDDISKGKPVGQFDSDDCTYKLFGYYLGGSPDISRAIANARTRKQTAITDVAMASTPGDEKGALRYATNIRAHDGGFNAGLFGKTCIVVEGMGYL